MGAARGIDDERKESWGGWGGGQDGPTLLLLPESSLPGVSGCRPPHKVHAQGKGQDDARPAGSGSGGRKGPGSMGA